MLKAIHAGPHAIGGTRVPGAGVRPWGPASIYPLMVSGGSVLRCDPRPWEALHASVAWTAADAAGLEDLVYRPDSVIMTYPAERGWTPT